MFAYCLEEKTINEIKKSKIESAHNILALLKNKKERGGVA